jgi:hypothetical protein
MQTAIEWPSDPFPLFSNSADLTPSPFTLGSAVLEVPASFDPDTESSAASPIAAIKSECQSEAASSQATWSSSGSSFYDGEAEAEVEAPAQPESAPKSKRRRPNRYQNASPAVLAVRSPDEHVQTVISDVSITASKGSEPRLAKGLQG